MPDRSQTLTRTRCPGCGTVFRVTSEQLRLKAGKVRCGHCQLVFNAFDHLLADVPAESPVLTTSESFAVNVPESAEISASEAALTSERSATPQDVSPAPAETPEESTLAAREAGLAAVRALDERPGFDRWSAGTLAGAGPGIAEAQAEGPRWPYVLMALLLTLVLLGQLSHHYRTALSLRLPSVASLFSLLGVDVPLPNDPAKVSIESSDLQADKSRKLFVLNATLKNRAAHAQAWPSLELTLTDVNDRVVTRRVLSVSEYLSEAPPPAAFAARAEVPVRLWIDARDVPAAGYRLYIFYP